MNKTDGAASCVLEVPPPTQSEPRGGTAVFTNLVAGHRLSFNEDKHGDADGIQMYSRCDLLTLIPLFT